MNIDPEIPTEQDSSGEKPQASSRPTSNRPIIIVVAVIIVIGIIAAVAFLRPQAPLSAEEQLKAAIAKEPHSADHHFAYADFLMGAGRVPEAEQEVKAGLAINPDHSLGNQMYAGLLAQQQRFALSANHIVQAIRSEMWPAPLFGRFIEVLAQAPDAEREEILQGAVRQLPLEGRILRAGWFSRNGNFPAAADQLRQTLDVQSSSTAGFLEAGKMAAAFNMPDVAQRLFTRAMTLSPANEETVIRLADGMCKENNPRSAEVFLRTEITSSPQSAQMMNALALLKATSDDPVVRNGVEAEKLARRSIEILGQPNFVLLDTLALALAEQERFEEAEVEAKRALEMARQVGSAPSVTEIEKRLKDYQAGKKPYGEPGQQPSQAPAQETSPTVQEGQPQ